MRIARNIVVPPKVTDVIEFALLEKDSHADIREMISNLFDGELKLLLNTASLLRNAAETERIIREMRRDAKKEI